MSMLSKAYYGVYGGELVTPSQHEARNRQSIVKQPAICPGCRNSLIPHGVGSPNVTERFRHHAVEDNQNRCPLHSESNRYGFLRQTPIDLNNGTLLRNEFFTKENLLHAYELCHSLKGGFRGCLSQEEFINIVNAADITGMWNYKGIKLWGVILILLLKTNYAFKTTGTQYYYKFKRKKRRRNCPENEWWDDVILQPCYLENSEEIDKKYKEAIPFDEDWYQKKISLMRFKEEYIKTIYSHFKVIN